MLDNSLEIKVRTTSSASILKPKIHLGQDLEFQQNVFNDTVDGRNPAITTWDVHCKNLHVNSGILTIATGEQDFFLLLCTRIDRSIEISAGTWRYLRHMHFQDCTLVCMSIL